MSYCVFRSDLMAGTNVNAELRSVRVYDEDDAPIAVENGTVVVLGELEEGNREVRKATLATAASNIEDCVIVAAPEVMYDERKKNLDEFINEAGLPLRAYVPHKKSIFSVTEKGFVGGAVPAKGGNVALGANGKFATTGTAIGKCIDVEVGTRYTYYVIELA